MPELENINLLVVHPVVRAGSVLFQSLFDNHPNVSTIPYFKNIYAQFNEITDLNTTQLYDFCKKMYLTHPGIFDTRKGYFGKELHTVAGAFGENFDQHIVTEFEHFYSNFNYLASKIKDGGSNTLSQKQLFILFHIAFSMCHGMDPKKIKYVLYHPHKSYSLSPLQEDFPDAFFVAMTRRLNADSASWKIVRNVRLKRKINYDDRIDFLQNICHYINETSILAELAQRTKNFLSIDLIDLHNDPNLIERLADWLGIEFNEALKKSTFCGLSWAGNSARRTTSSALTPGKRDDITVLSEAELEITKFFGTGSQVFWGYESLEKCENKTKTAEQLIRQVGLYEVCMNTVNLAKLYFMSNGYSINLITLRFLFVSLPWRSYKLKKLLLRKIQIALELDKTLKHYSVKNISR